MLSDLFAGRCLGRESKSVLEQHQSSINFNGRDIVFFWNVTQIERLEVSFVAVLASWVFLSSFALGYTLALRENAGSIVG
jgi:hypothetical protein